MRGFVEDRKKSTSVLQYEEARRAVGSSPTKLSGNRIAKEACLKSGFSEVDHDEIDKTFRKSDSVTTAVVFVRVSGNTCSERNPYKLQAWC